MEPKGKSLPLEKGGLEGFSLSSPFNFRTVDITGLPGERPYL
jgi:hypothetical protein